MKISASNLTYTFSTSFDCTTCTVNNHIFYTYFTLTGSVLLDLYSMGWDVLTCNVIFVILSYIHYC